MTNTTRKIDANTIEVSKVIPQEVIPEKTEKSEYDFDFLVEQKRAVEIDLANTVERHARELAVAEANLAQVVKILADCAKLGINGVKAEPEEEPEEEPV